ADDLVEVGTAGSVPLRVSRALIETDLIVTVTAAETVLHGGPSALLKACGREALRSMGAASLLEPGMSQGWDLARQLERPLDAIVIGIPPTTLFLPRSRPNPVAAAHLGLGLALRMWRTTFPVRSGGTAILLHDFQRRFDAPTQTPYRALFSDPRTARDREAV